MERDEEPHQLKVDRYTVMRELGRSHPNNGLINDCMNRVEGAYGSDGYFLQNPDSIIFSLEEGAGSPIPARREAAGDLTTRFVQVIHDENHPKTGRGK